MRTHPEPRIDFVVRCLRAAGHRRWSAIAKCAGVPEKTIYKIAYGETKDPRTSTTEALNNYFTTDGVVFATLAGGDVQEAKAPIADVFEPQST